MNVRMDRSVRMSALLLLVSLTAAGGVAGVAAGPGASAAVAGTCRPTLARLSLSPSSVPGGATSTATVTLNCAAPRAETVWLSGFADAAIRATVTVPAGQVDARTTVRTAVTRTTRRGTIAAAFASIRKTAALTVTPTPRTCKNPVLSGFAPPKLSYADGHAAAVLSLSCTAASAIRISLKSGNSLLPVPATALVREYYRTVTVPLAPRAYPAGQYTATLTAHYGATTLTRVVTVDPGLDNVSAQIVYGNWPLQVYTLLGITGRAPPGGATIDLKSSSAAVTMPASITIAPGATGAYFPDTSVQTVTKNTPVTVSATLGGRTLSSTTVLPTAFNSHSTMTISGSEGNVVYGLDFDLPYQVNLSNPAGASGLAVTMGAGSSSLALESGTTGVDPGSNWGQFFFNVAWSTAPVHTWVSATVDGVSTVFPITIEPGLSGVSAVSTMTAGSAYTGTVTLQGPVDMNTTVALSSNLSGLSVPASVTIPAGQSSVNFEILVASDLTTGDQAVITAALGTTDNMQSGTITIS